MLRAVSDHPDPQIAILMTGDGAGYDDRIGFHADLERMHEAGWGVEVISWRTHCKRGLREWATTNGVFIAIDDYYEQVTFLEGAMFSNALNLNARVLAHPRMSREKVAEEKVKIAAQLQIEALQKQLQALQDATAIKTAKKSKYEKSFNRGRRSREA